MNHLNDDVRKQLERVREKAQQRLNVLRQTVAATNSDGDGSVMRIAKGDAITPC
jgi:hypothetical protein